MNKQKLVILGASGHAYAVSEVVRSGSAYEIMGFLDDQNPEKTGTDFCGSQIRGRFNLLPELRTVGVLHAFVAIGDNNARASLSQQLQLLGFELASLIHPSAIIAPDVNIQAGTVVMPGAIVRARCQIGRNVIVNTAASLDHECVVEDDVHISPRVVMAGGCTVGARTWIGVGTVVSDHVSIGSDAIVGAGALVLKDVPSHVVAYGSPAKVQRNI